MFQWRSDCQRPTTSARILAEKTTIYTLYTGHSSVYANFCFFVVFFFTFPVFMSIQSVHSEFVLNLINIYTSSLSSLFLTRANEVLSPQRSQVIIYWLVWLWQMKPCAIMEQVGHLLLNEVFFSLFSHRQTKTKQQREAVHKGALVRWVTCCPLSLRSIKTIQQTL